MTSTLARVSSPKPYVQALVELAALIRARRTLIVEMTRRQITLEHSGKTLGAFWGVFQPLFLFAVYAFIYGVVFHVKIGDTYALPRNFTVYLLAGLIPWMSFLFLMAKATTLITGNVQLVKQVIFELSLLPVSAALAGCLTLLLGLAFLVVYSSVAQWPPALTYLGLPVLVVIQFVAMLGAAFALSAIGVFFRDIADLIQAAGVVLIFLMPIVYLPSASPSAFRSILWLNPFSYMIWCYQDLLYFGRFEHPYAWPVFSILAVGLLVGGYRLFRRLRPHYANVL